jgi:lipid-A-disaccharide synthase
MTVQNTEKKQVFLVAGEASGDVHGANLVRAIRSQAPQVVFSGIGGERMEEAGVRILFRSSELMVVGLTEVFSKVRNILRASFRMKSLIRRDRPDLLILIDFPDFNLNLARTAKRYSVPVLYYICPQVWAWRQGRVRKMARRIDRMAVILPFEQDYYQKRGLDVTYVGHPLLDSIPRGGREYDVSFKKERPDAGPVIGLMPGSRTEEIVNLLPPMVEAVEILADMFPNLTCLLPVAPTIKNDLVRSFMRNTSVEIRLLRGDTLKALPACDLVFVASGTATMEVGMMLIPMIIVYRVSPFSYWVAQRVVKVPHIGLVNLVAGEEVVPELIQDEVTPERLVQEALVLLKNASKRNEVIRKLQDVRSKFGQPGASEKTARIALDMIS